MEVVALKPTKVSVLKTNHAHTKPTACTITVHLIPLHVGSKYIVVDSYWLVLGILALR